VGKKQLDKNIKKQSVDYEQELKKYEPKHSVSAYFEGNMDRFVAEGDQVNREAEFGYLYAKLLGFGLSSKESKIVCLKTCFNWTVADIANELNITHRQTVHEMYKKSLVKLKEAGFKK